MSGGVPAGGYQHSAAGGRQQIQDVQAGLWWPAADPGKLRAAAAAWRQLAADVEQVTAASSAVVRQLSAENHGEGITALEAYWSTRWVGGGCLPAVVEGARALAQALDSYAFAVQMAQDRIKELIAAAATAAIVGIGLTVLTVGISDVAAGAVAASLIAAAAAIGVELSAEAAAIIATGLLVASAGALEGGLADLAIQGERVGYFHDQASIDWNEVLHYSGIGGATAGATFGAGTAIEAALPALGRTGARLLGRQPAVGSSENLPVLLSHGGIQSNAEAVSNPGGLPRTAATVNDVAARAGIRLRDTSVRIIQDSEVDYIRYLDAQRAAALTPAELAGSEIHVGPAAFTDEETLARVLGHEWTHVLQLRAGTEVSTASLADLEAQAYASEQAYVDNLRSSGR